MNLSIGPAPQQYDAAYLQRLINQLQSVLDQIHNHDVLHAEPEKLEEGMRRYADGTDWNPGSGKGGYEYNGTTWVKL